MRPWSSTTIPEAGCAKAGVTSKSHWHKLARTRQRDRERFMFTSGWNLLLDSKNESYFTPNSYVRSCFRSWAERRNLESESRMATSGQSAFPEFVVLET